MHNEPPFVILGFVATSILILIVARFSPCLSRHTEMIPIDQFPPAQSLKTAMIVVTVTPILCVYPFIQRYFVKGVMIGSIKG